MLSSKFSMQPTELCEINYYFGSGKKNSNMHSIAYNTVKREKLAQRDRHIYISNPPPPTHTKLFKNTRKV